MRQFGGKTNRVLASLGVKSGGKMDGVWNT